MSSQLFRTETINAAQIMDWPSLILGIPIAGAGAVTAAILLRRMHRKCVAETSRLRTEIENIQYEADRKLRVTREEFEEKGLIQAKHLAQVIKSRYALTSQATRLILEVLDLEGNSTMTRVHQGLVTSEGLLLHYMQHHFASSTPGGSIENVVLVASGSSEGVQLEIVEQKPTKTVFHVLFPGEMTTRPQGVDYEYRVHVHRGMLMTKEEADRAYAEDASPQEGFFHDNDIPTKLLELEVIFPLNYPACCSSHVYIGGSWIPHVEETKKWKLEKTERGAKLSIDNPIQGFRYLIDWLAPTQDQFEEIKKKAAHLGTTSA